MTLLAQSTTGDIFVSVLLVLLGGLLVVILIAAVRKWMMKADETDLVNPTGFNLSDLRKLKNEGQMTDEEFERAKAQIIAAAHKASTKPAPAAGIDPQPKDPTPPPAVGGE